jgi:hypothetical protein
LHFALCTAAYLFVLAGIYFCGTCAGFASMWFSTARSSIRCSHWSLGFPVACSAGLAAAFQTTSSAGQLVLCSALLGYVFAISVPTVIDRSLSFYILVKGAAAGRARCV